MPQDPTPPAPPQSGGMLLGPGFGRSIKSPVVWVVVLSLVIAAWVGRNGTPGWIVQKTVFDVQIDDGGKPYYLYKGKAVFVTDAVASDEATLTISSLEEASAKGQMPKVTEQFIYEESVDTEGETKRTYFRLNAVQHRGPWSLLPALAAIVLCLVSREPLIALLAGVATGAMLLQSYDLTDAVILPALASDSAAGVLLLYLWLLGALMGVWSKTGAAEAFAVWMTKHVVRGPKTARLVAWVLGVVFFQGGTVSTVLVGTAVKPLADKENISHEELSYIVDSTASPIASVLAFNAWPGYVQALIYVPGVAFLATDADRIAFFFKSVPLSFYGIFAVIGTFLLCMDKAPILGRRFREAIRRARETGQLDAPGSRPMSAPELQTSTTPDHYRPHVSDFLTPLVVLILVAIGTFIVMGSPKVRWAFGSAVLVGSVMALWRGLRLNELMEGIGEGLKGVVVASVILMLAIAIGGITQQTGAAVWLVDIIGQGVPFWAIPIVLQLLTMAIAFATGTSWGTYAVAFPLAMPLAWSVAAGQNLAHPELFMMVCFATVLNGSVFGDQCSPISDTTILSSMTTGADLMDHVKTQMVPASVAATLAAICWTGMALLAG